MVKCYICRIEKVSPTKGRENCTACQRCSEILKAPLCRGCGQPVRDAQKGDTEAYHPDCRRCSSCQQVVDQRDGHRLAGKILCAACDELFREFFVAGEHGNFQQRLQGAFDVWDTDKSGVIDKNELQKVLTAIMPNLSDRDFREIFHKIDSNHNGEIDYAEFSAWVAQDTPLVLNDNTFAAFLVERMREVGKAKQGALQVINEVQVRNDGVYFKLRSGVIRLETTAIRAECLSLATLEPEEFINKVECTEDGLVLGLNTGRDVTLEANGKLFGPWAAPIGFSIDGFRTKPLERTDENGPADFVVGIDLVPLSQAAEYDPGAALMFSADQEYMSYLRDILSKAAVDVNYFGEGGVTALMLAASHGSIAVMRMLLTSAADPNLADADGWTALTYASRYGSSGAVEALLKQGVTEGGGDGGFALSEALRSRFNASARALLRAGFGPKPPGTFALEVQKSTDQFKLEAPRISPAGGAFGAPRKVSILIGDQDASSLSGVKVLYSVDGRDPFHAGQRYMGAITMTAPLTQLRAVAVSGPERSKAVEASFIVCCSVLPEGLVRASIRTRLFPAADDLLKQYIAEALELPEDRLDIQANGIENEEASGACWLQMSLIDRKPRHQIRFDMAFATVRTAESRKKWLDNIEADIEGAVGEKPEDCKVFSGSVILEFEMTRGKAEELAYQLTAEGSFLKTKARCRSLFKTAIMTSVDALGSRLSDSSFHRELEAILHTKSVRPQIKSIGKGDHGFVACIAQNKKEAAAIKPKLLMAVKKYFPDLDAEEMNLNAFPLEMELEVNVELSSSGQEKDISSRMNSPAICEKISDRMAIMEALDPSLRISSPPICEKLTEIEVVLKWDDPHTLRNGKGSISNRLDCRCIAYAEEKIIAQISIQSTVLEEEDAPNRMVTKESQHQKTVCHSVMRATRCLLEPSSESGTSQQFHIDLAALPPEITDLYFIMSALATDDLSSFGNTSVAIVQSSRQKQLSEYTCNVGHHKAVVVSKLTRHGGGWVLFGLGLPLQVMADDVAQITAILDAQQTCHLNWERRRDLVKLRVLHKCKRTVRESTSDFAEMLEATLALPLAVFQLLVKML
eukprot:TRINITY_DN4728_c0_g5_i1.p1 TRINITY_DN4728_c0_g5~~TRINITY_DN4728_c0_g5_i1.p1  ORF type:complete len:1103 (+),score=189.44 TRINITY_DN4728_c0_g5_i1:52-3309(+)